MNPVALLQSLIRYDTTNPPGNESDCIRYIAHMLGEAGIETQLLGKAKERLNLVARLKGRGIAPPFLMYGHVDVVSAENQDWVYPPFEGVLHDDYIWGRGALDMKGAITMMVTALVRMKKQGIVPAGDIVLAVVSDEEEAGILGAKFLVDEHAVLFRDIPYAIGELGGFTLHMGKQRFYPIMVAEKQKCILRTIIKGPGGHGSMPMRGGAMAGLAHMLRILDKSRLPVHIYPSVEHMIRALVANLSSPSNILLRTMLNPLFTDKMLDLMGKKAALFDPILHHTVNATIIKAGSKINVIPSEIIVELDGRVLPGYSVDALVNELTVLVGKDYIFEVVDFAPGPVKINLGLFHKLENILKELDPGGIPIPFVPSRTPRRGCERLSE